MKKAYCLVILFGLICISSVCVFGCHIQKENDEFIKDVDKFIYDAEHESKSIKYDNKWNFIHEPDQFNSFYEGVHCITDETSKQWKWLHEHDYGYNKQGVAVYNNRVLVALTPIFGDIGDYVDLLLEDGTILPVIIVDLKWDADTYGHRSENGLNVIEILVSESWYINNHDNMIFPNVIGYR